MRLASVPAGVPAVHDHSAVEVALLFLPVAVLATLVALEWGARSGVRAMARFHRAYSTSEPWTKAAVLYMLISATVHLALIPAHLREPLTAALFGVDALSLTAISALSFVTSWWRPVAVGLLLSGIGAYALYVAMGRDAVDSVGILTKVVELAALALIVARDPLTLMIGVRRRGESFAIGGQ
jgi:hypothetical protein